MLLNLITPCVIICCSIDNSSSRDFNLSIGMCSNVQVTTGSGSASTLQVRDTCLFSVTLRYIEAGETWGGHANDESGTVLQWGAINKKEQPVV